MKLEAREIAGVEYCGCRRCRREQQARRELPRFERIKRCRTELLGVTRARGVRMAVIRFAGLEIVGLMELQPDAHPQLEAAGALVAAVTFQRRAALELVELVNAPGGVA